MSGGPVQAVYIDSFGLQHIVTSSGLLSWFRWLDVCCLLRGAILRDNQFPWYSIDQLDRVTSE